MKSFNIQEIIGNKGKIVFDDLSTIDISLGIENNNIDDLKEDLLQVELANGNVLDVGWYPSFDIEGHFSVCIIKNYDWMEPFYQKKCNQWNGLNELIKEALRFNLENS